MLTDKGIERLRPNGRRIAKPDGEGLYLIVNPGGSKSWASRYTDPNAKGKDKRQWKVIGLFSPELGVAKAREENREIQEMAKRGIDPANKDEGIGIDPTLEEVYRLFIRKGVDRRGNPLRPSTIEGYRQAFNHDVLPYLGKRKIRELVKRDILLVLEKIKERGSANQANQVYRRLRRVLAFAAARDIIKYSPMISMEPVGETNRRQRVLSDDEIKSFLKWKPRSDQTRRILRLILVTGARPGEVAGMAWEEIEGDWWTIPESRVKTGVPHRVYLTGLAKALLPERPKDAQGQPAIGPVFSITRLSVSQTLRRALNSEAEIPETKIKGGQPSPLHLAEFVPHDLRRTMATGLAKLKFPDEVINAVQGRAKVGIIGTYNLYEYDEERQAAAEAWCRKLQGLVAGTTDNVVPMTRKSR